MPRYRSLIWLEIEETLRKADLAEAILNGGLVRIADDQIACGQAFVSVGECLTRGAVPEA